MGRKQTARVDIDGFNQKSYGRCKPKIQRTYPSILIGFLSKKSWTLFCIEVDRAMSLLSETSYTMLCPLLFLPVVGCCIIGHHVEKNSREQRRIVLDDVQTICKDASNAGVRFYVREEDFSKSARPEELPTMFIEITVLESISRG